MVARSQPTNSICNFVAFDVETTGLNCRDGDRVIEVAAVLVHNFKIVRTYSSLVWTDTPIHPSALACHNIQKTFLLNAPKADKVFRTLHNFLGMLPIASHNIAFDISFLQAEYARLGLFVSNRLVDTLRFARYRYPRLASYRLIDVHRHLFGHQNKQTHRALADALMVAEILIRMAENEG